MLSTYIFSTAFAIGVLGIQQGEAPAPLITPGPKLVVRQCSGAKVTHVVVQGDTLSKIANQLQVGICNIAESNHIISTDTVYVSQTLSVLAPSCEAVNNGPGCTVLPRAGFIRTAVRGDYFWNYAVSQGIPVTSVIAANPTVPTDNIPIGARITIPAAS